MKILPLRLVFSLVIFSKILFGQEKLLISYEVFYNTERPITRHFNLYVDNQGDRSLFIQTDIDKTNEKILKQENDGSYSISYKSITPESNYFLYTKDTLESIENIRKPYKIVEQIPMIRWELFDEIKHVNGIKVQKAIGIFRGRKYIVWYSSEYPIKAGPWKLHGLPGLIFEAYDETKRYNWYLKKISYENFSNRVFDDLARNIEKISLTEYCEIRYGDNHIQKVSSKLPKGVIIESGNSERNGKEIKFEWEEQ